jgi:predicted ArsR family transcriptional regulator
MQTTKSQILALLKRSEPLTVGALTEALGLAPMTVRQHLTSLERDGLVCAAAERQPKGRPHYLYRLTEQGERSFPRRYDRLASQLLKEISLLDPFDLAALGPADRIDHMLRRLADRAVEQYALRLAGASLEERVRQVAAILQEESGFVEWESAGGRLTLRDYNCMYRSLTDPRGAVCAWHRRLIERLVGRPPIETATPVPEGCCSYVLTGAGRSESGGRRAGDEGSLRQRIPQEVH